MSKIISNPPNQPYEGRIDGYKLIESVPLKLYFASILGREDRTYYEWPRSGLSQSDAARALESSLLGFYQDLSPEFNHIGIPHIGVSFPHVTSIYRWGDPRTPGERETDIHKVALALLPSGELSPLRQQAKLEPAVGCPVGIAILNFEMRQRIDARTMEDYFRFAATTDDLYHFASVNEPNLFRSFLER